MTFYSNPFLEFRKEMHCFPRVSGGRSEGRICECHSVRVEHGAVNTNFSSNLTCSFDKTSICPLRQNHYNFKMAAGLLFVSLLHTPTLPLTTLCGYDFGGFFVGFFVGVFFFF